MIRIVKPEIDMEEDALKFVAEIREADKGCSWQYSGMACLEEASDYKEWVKETEDIFNGINLPEGFVPASTYMALDDEDKIVGMINIRHDLNDFLFNLGGHIGYSIRPNERKKGYGTAMLKLALDKCRELKMDRVLITCSVDNPGSSKVITNCGGIYENSNFKDDEEIKRYWIDL